MSFNFLDIWTHFLFSYYIYNCSLYINSNLHNINASLFINHLGFWKLRCIFTQTKEERERGSMNMISQHINPSCTGSKTLHCNWIEWPLIDINILSVVSKKHFLEILNTMLQNLLIKLVHSEFTRKYFINSSSTLHDFDLA